MHAVEVALPPYGRGKTSNDMAAYLTLDTSCLIERRLGSQGRQRLLASRFTAVTRFGADTTMLHAVLGMHLTLMATDLACAGTSLQQCASQRCVERGLAREHRAGRNADIRAIEVETDAANQGLDLTLAQASIGASRTSLGAVSTGIDAGGERLNIRYRLIRIGV